MELNTPTSRWLTETADLGVFTTDAELKIRSWNRWLEMYSRRRATEMSGQDLLAAYPDLAARRLDRFYRQALAGQVVMLSQRFHHYLLPMPVQSRLAGFEQMQQSVRIAPLVEDEQVVGTITVIEDVTDRVAFEEDLKRQLAFQEALHEIARAILTLDLSDCLRRVADNTAVLIGAPLAAVVLREEDGFRVAACTLDDASRCQTPLDADHSIAAGAAGARQAILIEDLHDPAEPLAGLDPLVPESRSVIAAPLTVKGRAIGALVVESPRPNAFTDTELKQVIALATQAAVAISNAQLHSDLAASEERHRKLAATLASERNRLRTLIDNLPDQVYVKDTAGRFLLANAVTAQFLGQATAEEILGKTDFDLHPRDLAEHYAAEEREILTTGRPLLEHEEPLVSPGGDRRWLLSTKVPLRDASGAITGLVGIGRDITERKETLDRIRFQAHLLDTVGQAVIATDVRRRIIYWNRFAETLYGWRAEEALGHKLLEITPAQATFDQGRQMLAALANGETWSGELEVWRRDGTTFPAMITNTPIRDETGTLIGVIGISFDLTERKRMEEAEREQRVLAEALRDTIATLTSTLDFDEVLDRILAQIGRVAPSDSADIMLLEDDIARIVRYQGYAERQMIAYANRVHFSLAETENLRTMAEAGRPMAIPDTRVYPGWVDLPETRWIRSIASAPIRLKDQTLGFLNLDSATPGFFTQAHAERLQAFADQAAIALENARLLANAERRAHEFATLYAITADLTAQQALPAVLQTIVERAAALFATPDSHLYLYDAARDDLELVAGLGLMQYIGTRLALGEGMAGVVAQRRAPLIVDDYRAWPGRSSQYDALLVTAAIQVPLLYSGKLIGVLGVEEYAPSPRTFTDADARLLTLLASHAAAAVHNAQLLAETQRRAEQLALVNEIGQELIRLTDVQTLLDLVVTRIVAVLGHYCAAVFLAEDDTLVMAVGYGGYTDSPPVGYRVPFGTGIVGQVAQTAETYLASDISRDPHYMSFALLPDTRSEIAVPLRSGDRVLGVMDIQSRQVGGLDETDRHMLEAVAAQLAEALENAQLYEQINRYAAELEEKVAARTAELSAANQRLEQAADKLRELNRYKSEFVSNVSHELRTPLSNIKSYLWLLDKGKPENYAEYMATLRRETDLLQSLIEDLLHLSRLDLGKVQVHLEPLDLSQVAGQLAGDRARLLAERGLGLRTALASDLPAVQADRKMLIQVLTNLMTNAMNYTPAGGTITVGTAAQERDGRDWATFFVRDTGPGITPEDQAHLFERFYRGQAGRSAPGTGLGLAICQELVQRHGGLITLDSQVGHGSTFTVWLPATDHAAD